MKNIYTQRTLASFTRLGLIVPELKGKDLPSVIKELCHRLHTHGYLPNLLPFYQDVLSREFFLSTITDTGLAFPHARISGIRQLVYALGRCPVPIVWEPLVSRATLVLLIVVPRDDSTDYPSFLAGLVKSAETPRVLAQLRSAKSASEILGVLEKQPLGDHHYRQ